MSCYLIISQQITFTHNDGVNHSKFDGTQLKTRWFFISLNSDFKKSSPVKIRPRSGLSLK